MLSDCTSPISLNLSFMTDIYPLIIPSAFESNGQTPMEWTTFHQMEEELRTVGEDIFRGTRDVGTQTDFSDSNVGCGEFDEICDKVLASLDYLDL